MPLLADSIVECGRRTLTNAINTANAWGQDPNGRWQNIEVVYGDTDSIFVKLPGRSVQEAFLFGEEFCKAVTDSNPPPVQLKLEKVGSWAEHFSTMFHLFCFNSFTVPLAGISRVYDADGECRKGQA